MRLSTITNWAYGITVLLTGLSGAAFLAAAGAATHEREAVEQHLAFDVVAEDLADGTDALTNQARLYAVRDQSRHLDSYRREALVVRTRDRALQRIRGMDAAPAELAALGEADGDLGELNRLEAAGVAAMQAGDAKAAQAILFGPEHERAQTSVLSALGHFRAQVTARTKAEMVQAQRDSDRAGAVAKVMLTLTGLLFLGVLYFVLKRRVSMPLTRMTGIVKRLARQDYDVEVPDYRRRDEIGDITAAIQTFRENGLERERLEAERQADQRAKDSILQMMQRLQACETQAELGQVVACFAPQTFPDLAGRLYVLDEDRHALSEASSWLSPLQSVPSFAPGECWGVRRGRPHASQGERQDICCPHIADPAVRSLCVPLTAQGDTIGLLYFEESPELGPPALAQRIYLDLMSDNIALALANLRLRERLANLAVRDTLTGLFNRRCLDEALNRPVDGSESLACIMIDIDHFKRFNDQFGHDAGDAVMQHVAQIMREVVQDVGVVYRFGGEEFTILLPKFDITAVFMLAERIRSQVAVAALAHHGQMLGHITISLGLAVCPDDGPLTTLLRRADAALLQAKTGGRNQTIAAKQQTASAANSGRRSA
jgi:diguanylate cyclase (GGDEF)-like protein